MEKYHFIGIGGIGMSALARILVQKGKVVQGSDPSTTYVTEGLRSVGIDIFNHHTETHVQPQMTVVYSTAIHSDHAEFQKAKTLGLPIFHRADLLSRLMEGAHGLLVTGTHGKTTTAALLAHMLVSAGLDPSYAIGGVALNLQSNGGYGKGKFFVAEADESDGSFLKHPCAGAIVTNLENDHLDYWKTEEALDQAFRCFGERVENVNLFFWCADNPRLAALAYRGFSYGFAQSADLRISAWRQEGWKLYFEVVFEGKTYSQIEIPLIGKHNVSNAAAVFGLGLQLGVPEETIRKALASFQGVKRRLEKKGTKKGVEIYDDYGHHPTEVQCTLKAARQAAGERRLVVAFQPHRYTRTRDCYVEFLGAFEAADVLVFSDIYSAGEEPIPGITGERLFADIVKKSRVEAHFVPRDQMAPFLAQFLRPHDIVVTMGAGNITQLGEELLHHPLKAFKIAYLYGGESAEHDVSILSAKRMEGEFNSDFYELKPFLIGKDGAWEKPMSEIVKELLACDLCFPMIHGAGCEDGMIQGFLETLGIPYTGIDYRGGPVAMDKAWTKHLARAQGIAVADFLEFSAYEWRQDPEMCITRMVEKFRFPFFVKPVHLGSTFGVCRVTDLEALKKGVEAACQIDDKFLAEEEMNGREMEIGLVGDQILHVSDPAEVLKTGQIYTYEGKYSPTKFMPAHLKVPLPPEVIAAGKKIAQAVYRIVGCSGFARVDFFLKPDYTWVLNEINPIPGCTPTSVYPKFWPAEGIPLSQLVDQIVIAALHRSRASR